MLVIAGGAGGEASASVVSGARSEGPSVRMVMQLACIDYLVRRPATTILARGASKVNFSLTMNNTWTLAKPTNLGADSP